MSLWAKFLDFFGFEDVDEEEEMGEDEVAVGKAPLGKSAPYRPQVVELPSSKNMKLVVLGPKSYEDVQSIVDHLRARRPVVVNLEGADSRVRVRILDFLSGAAYALGGRNQRVSEMIFLLAPANVDINYLLDDEYFEELDRAGKTNGV